jgi:hypothetical protein
MFLCMNEGVTIFFRVKHTLRTLAPEQVPSRLR